MTWGIGDCLEDPISKHIAVITGILQLRGGNYYLFRYIYGPTYSKKGPTSGGTLEKYMSKYKKIQVPPAWIVLF
jgi:hypothetical protein